MSFSQYRQDTEVFFRQQAFYEVEIERREWRFGNITHVLSLYEARRHPEDTGPERRGITSTQLYQDGRRWWITSILWDNERPGLTAALDHC